MCRQNNTSVQKAATPMEEHDMINMKMQNKVSSLNENINKNKKKFVPALRYKWLTGLYDILLRVTFREKIIKQAVIAQLNLQGNETILDFGCGSGTLKIMIKEQYPEVNIIRINVDEQIIAVAEKKVKEKGLSINKKTRR